MELSTEFKQKVWGAMMEARQNFGGADKAFAQTLDIHYSVFSRLQGGYKDRLLSDAEWIDKGRRLNVSMYHSNWKIAKTEVYLQMEENFHFCQKNQASMVLVDDCGIGKTYCAQIIIKKMKNAFYIDCSQYKTKRSFINALANIVGCGSNGKYSEVLANLKYYINLLEKPFICIDEAGDLDYSALLELKGLINGTNCSWYMIGADGLKAKINKGIRNEKVGFAEIFSRFSDDFVTLVPMNKEKRIDFYKKLIYDVSFVNVNNKDKIPELIAKCIVKLQPKNRKTTEDENKIKSLRYLKTAIQVIEA